MAVLLDFAAQQKDKMTMKMICEILQSNPKIPVNSQTLKLIDAFKLDPSGWTQKSGVKSTITTLASLKRFPGYLYKRDSLDTSQLDLNLECVQQILDDPQYASLLQEKMDVILRLRQSLSSIL